MNTGKKAVFVSHSGKQYVHRLIQGVLETNRELIFCTPLWWQSDPVWLKLLPPGLRRKMRGQIRKKSFPFSRPVKLLSKPYIILQKEMADAITNRQDKELNQTHLEIRHDLFASGCVNREQPAIVIGYEISSLATFEAAQKIKAVTVLDLAQIHYKAIDTIAQQYPDMHYILKNAHIDLIRERKQKEYDLADYLLTLSSFARQTLISQGIAPEKIFTLNLGFDVALFTPKQHYRTTGALRLMICGTDMLRKGLRLVLQVLANLQSRNLDIELTVIGSIEEATRIRKEFSQVHSVELIPFLLHEDLVKQYQQADLFVFPSYLDSWAMTVLEAMACGTPVIVTENTGSKDAVYKGGGWVIPPGSVEELEKAVVYFYENRTALQEYGTKALAVAKEYTWDNYNSQLAAVLEEIESNNRHS